MIQWPIVLAFLGATLLGYFLGRLRRNTTTPSSPQVLRALDRARAVSHELGSIDKKIRSQLGAHGRQLANFRSRLRRFAKNSDGAWEELAAEAESLLQPTLQLSSELAQAYDNVRQQANQLLSLTEVRTDPLTGVRNRRALDETLQTRLSMLGRYANPFSVAVLDVDHFKQVNDEHGHLEGDRILQDVAHMLELTVRDTDIVARFGGEEFVVVMPETDAEGAIIFAERMRIRIEESLPVTISGGIAEAIPGDDSRRLLTRADEALYAAKEAGRNQVLVYGDTQLV